MTELIIHAEQPKRIILTSAIKSDAWINFKQPTIFGKGAFQKKKCQGYRGGLTNNYPRLILAKAIYVERNSDHLFTIIKRCIWVSFP